MPFGTNGVRAAPPQHFYKSLLHNDLWRHTGGQPGGTGPAFPGGAFPLCSTSRRPPRPAVSHQLIVDLARNAILLALMVAGPMLVVALGVGLIVSVIQAVTQIQEQTLSFVPKLIAVGATFLIALPWILQILIRYTTELFRSLPSFVS